MTHYEKRQTLKQMEKCKGNLKKFDFRVFVYICLFLLCGTCLVAMTESFFFGGNIFSLELVSKYLFSVFLSGSGALFSASAATRFYTYSTQERAKIDYLNDKLDEDAKERDRQEMKQRSLAKQEESFKNSPVHHSIQTSDIDLLDYDVDSIFDENGFFRNMDIDAHRSACVEKNIQKEKPKTLSLGKKITRR